MNVQSFADTTGVEQQDSSGTGEEGTEKEGMRVPSSPNKGYASMHQNGGQDVVCFPTGSNDATQSSKESMWNGFCSVSHPSAFSAPAFSRRKVTSAVATRMGSRAVTGW